MPADGSPDTPMAVMAPVETANEAAPAIAAEPQRRRVRRKPAGAVTEAIEAEAPHAEVIEPNEAEPVGAPVELDVTPVEAIAERAEVEALIAEPEPETTPVPAAVVEHTPAPAPEADLSAIIAADPAQIAAPPEKPKRGWWRR
jgi:ribonuclease E